MPRAKDRRQPELHIRFGYNVEEGKQLHEYATEFAAYWRDQFGTVHFTATPEDGSWDALIIEAARAAADDEVDGA